MGDFKFECYDFNNNIIEKDEYGYLNKVEALNFYDSDNDDYAIQYIIDVTVNFNSADSILDVDDDCIEYFNNMSFIEKVCYYLNKIFTKHYFYYGINIKKIIFTLDFNKFIINRIKSKASYNIYNINYIENDKEIFNYNIILRELSCSVHYDCKDCNFSDREYVNIKLPLGDYVYELLENKEYFNEYEKYQKQKLNYEKMVLEKDTIIEDLKNKCNFINEITNINNSFNELKDKYNKLIDERNNFVEDEIKKYSNNLMEINKKENESLKSEENESLKSENERLKLENKKLKSQNKSLKLENEQLEEENKNNQNKLKQIQLIL